MEQNNMTAMNQLLNQLKDERRNMVMNREWDRCLQAVEMVIQNTYLEIEKKQIVDAYRFGHIFHDTNDFDSAEQYYMEEYGNSREVAQ